MVANGLTASVKKGQKRLVAEADADRFINAGGSPSDVMFLNAGLHSLRHGRGLGMAFQFGGVAEIELVCDIQMDFIKQIYVPYMIYIAKAAATIAAAQAFQAWQGALNLDGVITGADAEIQIFYAAPSAVEGENLDATIGNEAVYFIGPDQVNGIAGLASNVQTWVNNFVKNIPKDLNAADKAYKQFRSFYGKQVGFVECLTNESTQYPDSSQPPGNCILTFSSSCVELDYSNGFNSVYNPSGPAIPSPVIIMAWNVPSGAMSIGTFDFEPATTPNPPGACSNPGGGN